MEWTENIWLGVSVESSLWSSRIDSLRHVPAKAKFVSFEPLLEEIKSPNLTGIDWVIVGGESGGNARPIRKEWILSLKDVCANQEIPFFFKQWGRRTFNPDPLDGTLNKLNDNYAKGGCQIDGRVYKQMPTFGKCHYP